MSLQKRFIDSIQYREWEFAREAGVFFFTVSIILMFPKKSDSAKIFTVRKTLLPDEMALNHMAVVEQEAYGQLIDECDIVVGPKHVAITSKKLKMYKDIQR